jgi:hypothetical protein
VPAVVPATAVWTVTVADVDVPVTLIARPSVEPDSFAFAKDATNAPN